MSKRLIFLFAVLPLAGCFTGGSSDPVKWTLEAAAVKASAHEARLGTVRISRLAVRPPYDSRLLTVLRPDGSLAFDPYNQFALAPSTLLTAAALDVVSGSGVFRAVLPSSTAARTDASLEISVDRFALDCRAEGLRDAAVEVTVWLVKDRTLVKTVKGEALKSARDGGYAAAFSAAFADALSSAVDRL